MSSNSYLYRETGKAEAEFSELGMDQYFVGMPVPRTIQPVSSCQMRWQHFYLDSMVKLSKTKWQYLEKLGKKIEEIPDSSERKHNIHTDMKGFVSRLISYAV